MATTYPKRLIEVDLPIKRISAHARREKSIRHGHISTLHLWWARRPLAACRAVICASLWPDPADAECPQAFRDTAAKIIQEFARSTQSNRWGAEICDDGSFTRYMRLTHNGGIDPSNFKAQVKLRAFLLDFIADFASWEASTNRWFLDTARSLTQAAHEALGGARGTHPLVLDPFAGGGAIPLEALRVGADSFASDLNPVAVLLNKVVQEYIPKYGERLAADVRKYGKWLNRQAEEELSDCYPRDVDGSTPIAYLWARTIKCEGPACGATVPLIKSLWLAKRTSRAIALKLTANADAHRVGVEVCNGVSPKDVGSGTVRNGSATCPACGHTTANSSVRNQLSSRRGGADDAMLLAVVLSRPSSAGRSYRAPTQADYAAAERARSRKLAMLQRGAIPNEPIPRERPSPNARGLSAVTRMGMETFGDLFTSRQSVALATIAKLTREAASQGGNADELYARALHSCLALAVDRVAERCSSLARWDSSPKMETVGGTFGRQALSIVWDFAEQVPTRDVAGSWLGAVEWVALVCDTITASDISGGTVERASATEHPLPSMSVSALVTDPPYYDSVPYGDLSDYFYVWLRRTLSGTFPDLFPTALVPKDEEAIWNPSRIYTPTGKPKDTAFYEAQMTKALAEGRRVCSENSIAVVVFAHKSTAGWEAILSALSEAGWVATASWPIDTEMGTRVNAVGTASLASSVHIVCRPRSHEAVGDWRDVLAELPMRIREWMARLSKEGVVGADAIFACLGPALEIFSRYSRVEKASGEQVLLKDYLTYVWGAVAQEALAQIFKDADATGFEEDARLTAMWLWTLNAGTPALVQAVEGDVSPDLVAEDEATTEEDEEDVESNGKAKGGGYVLEFDAARKIAQGLGAHLEQLTGVIEVKGDKARLLGVAERTKRLFGKDEADAPTAKRKKKDKQMKLFSLEEVEAEEGGWGDKSVPKLGDTVLDRIHQSMILFAAGRGEALRRFLVEDGAGQDQRFWKLANALSALYPQGTDEKRWVDGVLARKKGLGL